MPPVSPKAIIRRINMGEWFIIGVRRGWEAVFIAGRPRQAEVQPTKTEVPGQLNVQLNKCQIPIVLYICHISWKNSTSQFY